MTHGVTATARYQTADGRRVAPLPSDSSHPTWLRRSLRHACTTRTSLGKAYDRRLVRRLLVYVRPYRLARRRRARPADARGAAAARRAAHDAARDRRRAAGARRRRWSRASAMLFAASLVVAFACQYGETMLTALLGQRVMRDLRRSIFAHVQRLSDRVLRPQSGGTARHARDVRRRIAQRAVHRGRRRGTRRPVHAARDRA